MSRARGLRVAVVGVVLLLAVLAFPWSASASGSRSALQCKRAAPLAGQETLLAAGFLPHETVTGVLMPGDVVVGSTTAAGRGIARLTFKIPGGLSGSYQALLTGGASATTVSCLFRIAAHQTPGSPKGPMSAGEMALLGLGAIAALLAAGGSLLVAVGHRTARTRPEHLASTAARPPRAG